jgi:hypothetical protein
LVVHAVMPGGGVSVCLSLSVCLPPPWRCSTSAPCVSRSFESPSAFLSSFCVDPGRRPPPQWAAAAAPAPGKRLRGPPGPSKRKRGAPAAALTCTWPPCGCAGAARRCRPHCALLSFPTTVHPAAFCFRLPFLRAAAGAPHPARRRRRRPGGSPKFCPKASGRGPRSLVRGHRAAVQVQHVCADGVQELPRVRHDQQRLGPPHQIVLQPQDWGAAVGGGSGGSVFGQARVVALIASVRVLLCLVSV